MKTIVKMQFGSHVYGTNLPTSDLDYKAVAIPDRKDILLQNVFRSITENTNKANTKNTAEDVDFETFSFHQYLKLLLEGQTVPLDMLFTPKEFLIQSSGLWDYLKEHKDEFFHSGILSFVGYCRTQANKYGIKGSRMGAFKRAIELIASSSGEKLSSVWEELKNANIEHVSFIDLPCTKTNTREHIDICGRKFDASVKISYALPILQAIYDNYGERSKLAEKNEGIDWKALMHACRVLTTAKEILLHKNITFPRPDKDFLLKVRQGQLAYKEVSEYIENGLKELEEIQKISPLPSKPNRKFVDDLVVSVYGDTVMNCVEKQWGIS